MAMDRAGLESRLDSLDHLAAACTLLVVLGVGGEFVAHIASSRTNKRLAALHRAEEKVREEEIARLTNDSEHARKQTEELRRRNLELENSLAPRDLLVIQGSPNDTLGVLRPFKGTGIVIEFIPDVEARRAAEALRASVEAAGWRVLARTANEHLLDGVTVTPWQDLPPVDAPPASIHTPDTRTVERCAAAADALVEYLRANRWQASTGVTGSPRTIPPGALRVGIGFKPSPYFEPALLKTSRQETERLQRELRDEHKSAREWLDRRSKPTPEK